MIGMNDTWRKGRRLLDRSFRPGGVMTYRRMMQEKTSGFLARLSATPKNFHSHIKLSVSCLTHNVRSLTARQPSGKDYHVCHIRL